MAGQSIATMTRRAIPQWRRTCASVTRPAVAQFWSDDRIPSGKASWATGDHFAFEAFDINLDLARSPDSGG
jgi:hypothetical protein